VVQTVERVAQEEQNPALHVLRVVPTHYRKTALAEAILGKLQNYFPGRVTPALGFNVKIDEAQSHGQTIWQYAPKSRGAQMLAAIAEDIRGASESQAASVSA
jgi:chromosome partitioning protein